MELLTKALPWLVGGVIVLLLLAVLRRPLKWLLKLAARTGIGLVILWLLSHVGGFLGLNLGVNVANALVLALLGLPGFGLLVGMSWMLSV